MGQLPGGPAVRARERRHTDHVGHGVERAGSRVTYGVVLGLVLGKIVGILGASWIATRLRVGTLPHGASWSGLFGVGAVAGIGFTVSIFIAGLAFDDKPLLENDAKIGILAASVIVATVGSLILTRQASGDRS